MAAVTNVLSLCRALRDGVAMLGLSKSQQAELLQQVTRAERAATAQPIDGTTVDAAVRSMRYLLVEVADGPIAAFMADAAAEIIGDGIGKMFS